MPHSDHLNNHLTTLDVQLLPYNLNYSLFPIKFGANKKFIFISITIQNINATYFHKIFLYFKNLTLFNQSDCSPLSDTAYSMLSTRYDYTSSIVS